MKTSRLAIAVSSLFFVLTAVSAQTPPSVATLTANPVYQKAASSVTVKPPRAATSPDRRSSPKKPPPTSADDLRNVIANGKGRMPKHAGKLTSEEIDTLVQ